MGGVRIFLRIDSEPGVLARVLEPFSVAGHAPRALMLRPAPGRAAFVVAEFDSPAQDRAAFLTERLRQMPCVMGARLARGLLTSFRARGDLCGVDRAGHSSQD